MYTFLIVTIYLAFVSLGLPDSLLGSAWPIMQLELDAPLSAAGLVTMIIAAGTILSSLSSDRLTRKIGAGPVTALSVLITTAALFGFSRANSMLALCLIAVPYGLGAGAVDAALNHFVATQFSAKHMSWLHAFWGIGAAFSPYVMGYCLTSDLGWRSGYFIVGCVQLFLAICVLVSLPAWKSKTAAEKSEALGESVPLPLAKAVRIRGVKQIMLTFFGYCALESTAGLWASSYLVRRFGVDAELAANFGSLFFVGITLGRFLSGCIAERFGDRKMIRWGILIQLTGAVLVAVPLFDGVVAMVGLVVVGLGCAPVYPSIIHSTPDNFGAKYSQTIIGIQMASAYVGSTLMPPIFGLIAQHIHIGLYPLYLFALATLMLTMSESLNRRVAKISLE